MEYDLFLKQWSLKNERNASEPYNPALSFTVPMILGVQSFLILLIYKMMSFLKLFDRDNTLEVNEIIH